MKMWRWYLLSAILVILDQWTKGLASTHLVYGVPQTLLPVFDLLLQHNPGAAFSFLSEAGGWQRWFFLSVSVLASVFIFCWLPAQQRFLSQLGLSLVLAGAVGNLWDRAVLGYVVDFISVHYQQHRFPTFNVADSAISVGAVILALEWLWLEPRDQKLALDDL